MITKQELLSLYLNLNKLGNLKGVKFSYGVSKNLALLSPEIESLNKVQEMSEEFKKFEEKRVELIKDYSKKDESGKDIIENNSYVVLDQKKWDKVFDKLKEDNKEVVKKREKQIEEYLELLKTESDIKLYKIKLADIPEDITTIQMNSIISIIIEE